VKFNTNKFGDSFHSLIIEWVWHEGLTISGYNSTIWRQDICGAWMNRFEYGNTHSIFGWEIDHIYPKVLGGLDRLSNLQPLNWKNNRHKSDSYPMWFCNCSNSSKHVFSINLGNF
jgi:hypothetical protein